MYHYPMDEQAKQVTHGMLVQASRDLMRLSRLVRDGEELDEDQAAEWYAAVQDVRRGADYYERGLIRQLKYEQGMTWAAVADAVQANLNSRQAAQMKWKRLLDGDRREPGGAGRGGWPKGRPRV